MQSVNSAENKHDKDLIESKGRNNDAVPPQQGKPGQRRRAQDKKLLSRKGRPEMPPLPHDQRPELAVEFWSERIPPQLAAGLASEYDYVLTLRIELPCSLLQGVSI